MGRGGKDAGRGRLDPRSRHWPGGKGSGGWGGRGEREHTNTAVWLYTPNSTWIGGISGKARRCSDTVGREFSPLTAHHPNTLTSQAGRGWGGWRAGKGTAERFRPRRRSRRQHLSRLTCFKSDTSMAEEITKIGLHVTYQCLHPNWERQVGY